MQALGRRLGGIRGLRANASRLRGRWLPRSSSRSCFARDDRGSVGIVFGLMLTIMLVFVGASVDISRWLRARTQTWQALDSAVLAGARALQLDNENTVAATAMAQRFYNENVKRRVMLSNDSIAFAVSDAGTAISVTGSASIGTLFLRLIGVENLALFNLSDARMPKSKLAIGANAESSVEIGLMLDVTGSMAGTKLSDMQAAAKNLVDIVVWQDQSTYTSRVALIPFSQAVNMGTYAASVRGNPAATLTVAGSGKYAQSTTYKLTSCVSERTGTAAYTDQSPTEAPVGPVYSKTGTCSPTQTVVPLTSDTELLKASIDSFVAGGSTAGHLGTAWTWYALSPNWSSVWPAASEPGSYGLTTTKNRFGNPKLRKIAVLMTDGEYNIEYCSNGLTSGGSCSSANGASATQAAAMCSAMKDAGLLVFTIGFQVTDASKTFLQTCSSGAGYYYDAIDGAGLSQAFSDIALKIASLYLSQ